MPEQGDKNEHISDEGKKLDALADMIRDACAKMDEGAKRMDARMDALEESHRRMDAEIREKGEPEETAADRRKDARGDASEEEEEKREDASEEEEKREDARRKDSEGERQKEGYVEDRKDASEEEEEKREDARRKDSKRKDEDEEEERMSDAAPISRAEAARLRAEIAALNARAPAIISDSDRERFAVIQEQADAAFQAFSDRAPAPLQGETPTQYKRRLGSKLQGHSPKWKDARLSSISDEVLLDTVVSDIFADSISAARAGTDVPAGQLRERVRQSGGHTIIEFEGASDSWMNSFAGNSQRATGSWLRPN